METRKRNRAFLGILLFLFGGGAVLQAQMDAYFTTISHPVPQDTMMVMLLSDFQSARSTNDFFTGMSMVQYGLTPRWTVGFMREGQKIFGSPTTYGGLRVNSYSRVFPHDHLLNFTLYGEYEGLNGAGLYKMEVAGFGGEDLNEPLAKVRRTAVRTFEQRAIMYSRLGSGEPYLQLHQRDGVEGGENDFGYAWGVFRQATNRAMGTGKDMVGMPGTEKEKAPPPFSFQRLGYGLDDDRGAGQHGSVWLRLAMSAALRGSCLQLCRIEELDRSRRADNWALRRK